MRKLTLEYVRSMFAEVGYTLLADEYVNSTVKMPFRCDRGHEHVLSWGKFSLGRRCAYCSNKVPMTIERVSASFKDVGYKLISTEYVDVHTKLEYICDQGHRHSISWNNFNDGHRCFYCSKNIPPTIEEISESFSAIGWTLLTDKYKNKKQLLEFICDIGHRHSICWDSFQAGHRCGRCYRPEKTEEELLSQKIANTLVGNFSRNVRNFGGSKTTFCNILAKEILQALGPRPSEKHHLDHVIPKSWFCHHDRFQVELCWNVKNFQWLIYDENIRKRNKLPVTLLPKLTPYQVFIANIGQYRPKDQRSLMERSGLWMSKEDALERLNLLSAIDTNQLPSSGFQLG